MSIFIPFNHQPANIPTPAASYTCPAGKYARVVATLNVDAYISAYSPDSNSDFVYYTETGGKCESIELWITEGDVLTKTETAPTDTSNTSVNTSALVEAIASISINSGGGAVVVSEITARASARIANGGATNDILTASSTATVKWHIEEYNVLT